jgi:hypothetical protein
MAVVRFCVSRKPRQRLPRKAAACGAGAAAGTSPLTAQHFMPGRDSTESRKVVDWAQVCTEFRTPPVVEFQRPANAWLKETRGNARISELLPLRAAGVEADIFDQLRSPFLLLAGSSLSALHQIRELLSVYPLNRHELVNLSPLPGFQIAWRTYQSETMGSRAVTSPGRPSIYSRLHSQAYQWKREAQRRRLPRRIQLDNRPVVLAVPRLDGQITDMLPVTEKLSTKHGIQTVFALVDSRLEGRIKQEGYPYVGLFNAPWNERRAAHREARRVLEQTTALLARVSIDHAPDPVTAPVLKEALIEVLQQELRDAIQLNFSVVRLIQDLNPVLILAGNPYTQEGRVATKVGEQMGVKTVAMEHGTIFPNSPVWDECTLDAVCVWGEPSRRALLSSGLDDQQIRVTGAPRYDVIFRDRPEASQLTFVLVATSGAGDQVNLSQHQGFIRTLYDAADMAPEIQWLVKLHPKDREELYRVGEGPSHPRVQVVRAEGGVSGLGIFEYLRRAKALVTISSSSALDAMAVDVPVISVNVWPESKSFRGVEFLERRCTRAVRTAAELAAEVRKAWNDQVDPVTQQAASAYAAEHFVNRGNAAQAVAEELVALIGRTNETKQAS